MNEDTFKLLFAVFWVLNTVVRVYFQRIAIHAKRAAIYHQSRERVYYYTLMLMYLMMALYFTSSVVDFASIPLPDWARIGGVIVLLAFLWLFAASHRALGRNWSGRLEIHQDHVLITTGPYKLLRHPMYLAFYLSAIGYFLLSANLFISLPYVLALTWMYCSRVDSEEQMMIEHFGEAYRTYMQTTARLIPGFKSRAT